MASDATYSKLERDLKIQMIRYYPWKILVREKLVSNKVST